MAVYEGITIGMGIIAYLFFSLWHQLREEHENLSLLFFGMGLVVINILTFTIVQYMLQEVAISYLKNYASVFLMVIMWFSIIVCVYILFGLVFGFIKVGANWLFEQLGWKPPFEE